MRGVYALVLVAAFSIIFASTLVRFLSVEEANRAMLWYVKTKSQEYMRRDFELSVRRALEYAARSCYPPTTTCVEARASAYLSDLSAQWSVLGVQTSLDPSAILATVVYIPKTGVYIVRVSITKPVDGYVGDVRIHIPAGFSVEVTV